MQALIFSIKHFCSRRRLGAGAGVSWVCGHISKWEEEQACLACATCIAETVEKVSLHNTSQHMGMCMWVCCWCMHRLLWHGAQEEPHHPPA